MPAIRVENIHKSYGKKLILDGVGLTADPGMCVGILGSNGCGKSTLLQILAGELRPDAGSFYVETELMAPTPVMTVSSENRDPEAAVHGEKTVVDLLRNPSVREQIVGYAPQGTPLIAELNALDNLRLWYDRGILEASLKNGPLSLLGIPSFLKTPVRKMSGGMKKRLSIGCAIAGNPKILLLDEPGAALDLLCKEAMENYFRAYLAAGGTIFIVTHDVQELRLCSSSYILKNGHLEPFVYDGDVRRLTEALRS